MKNRNFVGFGFLSLLVIFTVSNLFKNEILRRSEGLVGAYYIGTGEIWVSEKLPKAIRVSIEFHETMHQIFFTKFPWYWDFAYKVGDIGRYLLIFAFVLVIIRLFLLKDIEIKLMKNIEKVAISLSVVCYFLAYLPELHAYSLQLINYPMWFVLHNLSYYLIMVFYPLALYVAVINAWGLKGRLNKEV